MAREDFGPATALVAAWFGLRGEDRGPAAAPIAAWFGLRAEDRGAAAVALHSLRGHASRIVAARCRCGIAVAEDHVADAVFVMVYGIRRAPRLRISATTTLGYLCGVARNEWRWDRWRRARETGAAAELAAAASGLAGARCRSRRLESYAAVALAELADGITASG